MQTTIGTRVRMTGDLGDAVATGTVVGFLSTVDLEGVDSAATFVRFDDGEVIGCHRDHLEAVSSFVGMDGDLAVYDVAFDL